MIGSGKGNDDGRSPSRPLTNSSANPSEEQRPPQDRDGQGPAQYQQHMQPGYQQPQSHAIQRNMGYPSPANNQQNAGYQQERATPKQSYNPNDYQQQGGTDYIPPAQNPMPLQQDQPPIFQPTQMMPPAQAIQPLAPHYNQPVQQSAPQYNEAVPEQAQMYSVPQQEPQSTVNEQPIYPEQIVAVYKLKGPYIEHRKNELNKEISEYQKKKLGIEWSLEERDLLDDLVDIAHTRNLLEMDVIIQGALVHFGILSNALRQEPPPLLEKVYKEVQKKYEKAFGKTYGEDVIKNVLLVFVRYRLLSEYFRKQNPPVRLKHWLDKQWLAAEDQGRIKRSPNPLPDGK